MSNQSSGAGANVYADMAEQQGLLDEVFSHSLQDLGIAQHVLSSSQGSLPPLIIWLARGSTAHAIESVAPYLSNAMDIPWVRGDVSTHIHGSLLWPQGTVFVVASQSGDTPDLVLAAKRLVSEGNKVLITTNAGGALKTVSDFHIPIRAGSERAVPATKSVFAQIASLLTLGATWTNSLTPELIRAVTGAVERASEIPSQQLLDALGGTNPVASIGSGEGLGLAKEFAHKVQETSALPVLALESAEFEHGPVAVCNASNSVVAFHVGNSAATTSAVKTIRSRGSRIVEIGATHESLGSWELLPGLVQAQKLTMSIAISRGIDPDHAFGLSKVTNTYS